MIIILFGKQLSSRYYVTLDIINKKTKGVVNSKNYLYIGEFAIYKSLRILL